MSKNLRLCVIMLSAIVTISSLYITQPIQPLLVSEFQISKTQVSLFTSVVLLALAFAPIFYGYLLEKFQTRLILSTSLSLTGIFQCLLCLSINYEMFLTLRILEALVIPAALTATLTTLMRLDFNNTQKYISIYVASTVFGGVLSRVGGGLLTTLFSWQFTFITLGITTLIIAILTFRFPNDNEKIQSAKITPKIILTLLGDRRYVLLYGCAFLVCFCFQGALNFMPFEITQNNPSVTPAQIGFLYVGYIIGIITALLASRITKFIGGEIRTIVLGFIIFSIALLIMLLKDFWWLFFAVFVICIGMFITHSVLSSFVNSISTQKKGITNGLYLAFYYTGGTFGTTLPSYLYHHYGWNVLCCFLSFILFMSAFCFWKLQFIFKGI